MTTHNKLTCLFGHHDYSEEVTKDRDGFFTHLCKICKKSGCQWRDDGVIGYWCDYDGEGNCIYEKWSDGCVRCYNKKGTRVYEKLSGETERWLDDDGCWVEKKPKNWKYDEKYLQ